MGEHCAPVRSVVAAAEVTSTLFLSRATALTGECDRGIGQIEQHVYVARVAPLTGDRGSDIGLVLMIREYHVHGEAVIAELADCLPRCGHRSGSTDVAERARLVVQNPDADGLPGLRPRRPGRERQPPLLPLRSREGFVSWSSSDLLSFL